jgi:hypothetical protein
MRFVRTLAVITGCFVILSACGQGPSADRHPSRPTTTTAPPLPGGYGLAAPNPTLTDRIELATSRIRSGRSLDGALIVVNHSTRSINLTHPCRPEFTVALTNSRYMPLVAFTTGCSDQAFMVKPGTNRLPLHVTTTYLACGQTPSSSTKPRCTSSGPPPLPPGIYDAVLIGFGLRLPEPQPVAVTLTS